MKAWAVLLLSASGFAQTGSLTVAAVDSHHQPVASVKVVLQQAGKQPVSRQTDGNGLCHFSVPTGEYTVRAEDSDAPAKAIRVEGDSKVELTLVEAPFFDEPQFTVAGVTDNTYRGGHGADTVLRSSEDLSKATATLGSQEQSSGDLLEAAKKLQLAAESNPTEPSLFAWGTELLSYHAPQQAVSVFTKGTRLFPESGRMLLGLASAYYAAGAYEQAAHCFFQAADKNPNDPKPYLFLAKVEAKEITGSAGYRERMARFAGLHPENALAHYYYALCLADHAEAIAQLNQALNIDPKLALVHLQKGIIDTAEGKNSEAITEYQQAAAEDPSLEQAHFRLSEAYRIAGDRKRSLEELAIFRRLNEAASKSREQERRQGQRFVLDLKTQ